MEFEPRVSLGNVINVEMQSNDNYLFVYIAKYLLRVYSTGTELTKEKSTQNLRMAQNT